MVVKAKEMVGISVDTPLMSLVITYYIVQTANTPTFRTAPQLQYNYFDDVNIVLVQEITRFEKF